MGRSSRFWIGFLAFVLVAVIAIGMSGLTWTDIRNFPTPPNKLVVEGEEHRIPLPDSGQERMLPEVAITTSGVHEFMFLEDGEPVRWDPCRPVYFVLNPEGAPPGSEELILEAVERVSQATGLSFEYEGYTTEKATFNRPLIQEGLYGDRFVPLVFGWATEAENPELAETVAGLGGSSSVPGAYGPQRYLVGGTVVLDTADIARMMSSGDRGLAVAVMMHEIGHVVGLGHVDDPTELMNATNTSLRDFGPGDREGLAIAGSGPCQPG